MLALFFDWFSWSNPLLILFGLFALWMLVDAVRREEWLWVVFILIFPILNAPLYFFLVYRAAAGPRPGGFELPGARTRQRIKELEDRIHHLDNARDHTELADIYLEQGKLPQAEASYRAALERDPHDRDTLAHYGQCLLRLERAAEALPLLERVCTAAPEHDFGHTLMALAETYAALGRTGDATKAWRGVIERHTYARARVQLAELLLRRGEFDEAGALLEEVLEDDAHAPAFQRKRERPWVQKARLLRRQVSA
jgi:hypothetical protein